MIAFVVTIERPKGKPIGECYGKALEIAKTRWKDRVGITPTHVFVQSDEDKNNLDGLTGGLEIIVRKSYLQNTLGVGVESNANMGNHGSIGLREGGERVG